MTLLGGALTLAALGTAALPMCREARRSPIAALRDAAPGGFAKLPSGTTHYQWFGPESGPVTVCIHGLTTPSFVWQGLVPHLVKAGQRVLTYDLYGRGYSDAPRGAQTPAFFIRQLTELLAHVQVPAPVTLIGYSMGGAIAACMAAQAPERIARLVLLAPAGMGHDLGSLSRRAAQVPLIGDWLFHMAYPGILHTGIESERGTPGSVPDIADQQLFQLTRRGYLRAVLSSLRGQLARPLEDEHCRIARAGTPVLAIWGRDDSVIPIRAMGTLAQWNRSAHQEVIAGAGHGLTYTHTPQVARAILA
ncbi:alpha/beta fold hydrolase [Maliponia aquimaris]|uniref:Arylesterase n=1 Tax=Maliponia aquimaris TaxID=1673631 RepID=A0A238K9I3_9RHOB|nr:alpha/beta hydrolase [Maliponia aquimaris]SMX39475.1 Arylesterase [Maliponia aquimaris]